METKAPPKIGYRTLRHAIIERQQELQEDVLVVEHWLELRGLSSGKAKALMKLRALLKVTINELERHL